MTTKQRNTILISLAIVAVIATAVYYLTREREVELPPLTSTSTGEVLGEESGICIQVITPARNPATGEVRDFPTPCDVPEGWVFLSK